jgi:hypothetical protein
VEERPEATGAAHAWRIGNPPSHACLVVLSPVGWSPYLRARACAWWVLLLMDVKYRDSSQISPAAQAPVRTQVHCGDRSVLIRSTTVTRCSLVQCTVCSLVVGRLSSVWRDRYGGTYQLLALALTFSHLHTLPWIMRKRGWPFGIIVI